MTPGGPQPSFALIERRLTEVEHNFALLQGRVTSGMENVSNVLGTMSGELRDLNRTAQTVAVQQNAMESHGEGLERAFKAIKDLADNTTHGFEKEREARGATNEVARTEVQKLRDQVILWRGIVLGFGVAATLLVSAAIYIVRSGFLDAQSARQKLEQTINGYDARLDSLEQRRTP